MKLFASHCIILRSLQWFTSNRTITSWTGNSHPFKVVMHHRRLSLCWIYESFPESHRTRFIRRPVTCGLNILTAYLGIEHPRMFNFLYISDPVQSVIHSLATTLLPRMNIIATYVYHHAITNVQYVLKMKAFCKSVHYGIAAYYCLLPMLLGYTR